MGRCQVIYDGVLQGFRCRGPLESRSGTPSSVASDGYAGGWDEDGWHAAPSTPAVLDQPQLPTVLWFMVSPVVPQQRTGSISSLGGGQGGRPDPAQPPVVPPAPEH
ncbi:unnamed protein product [Boreogadus saida]